jgi:hypothetical protein
LTKSASQPRSRSRFVTTADAWSHIHDVTPPGWHVGRPTYNPSRRLWEQYAFDPAERPKVGLRSHEWCAVGETELGVLEEMARSLAEINDGRMPR